MWKSIFKKKIFFRVNQTFFVPILDTTMVIIYFTTIAVTHTLKINERYSIKPISITLVLKFDRSMRNVKNRVLR